MDFQILRRQPIEFFENKGVKYFKPFVALDKTKKPLKVYCYKGIFLCLEYLQKGG